MTERTHYVATYTPTKITFLVSKPVTVVVSGISGIDILDSLYLIRNSSKVHINRRVLRFRSSVAENSVLLAYNSASLDSRYRWF